MYACRFRISPLCSMVGTPLSQYGVVCAICICIVGVGLASVVPSLANWSATSLPIIPVWALTFWIVILWFDH